MARIENVSDTALWVAMLRAQETARPDALFRDPLASRLAGERGQRILQAMPHAKLMAWVLLTRTIGIDRLVQRAIQAGVDTVINLGAGLDTRPYRMTLPAGLRWIEVDFAHIVELKNEQLRTETPVCRLERVALDLSDRAASRAFYARIGGESQRVLLITEGVIPYLSPEQAGHLADDLAAIPNFTYWIQDYREGGFTARLRGHLKRVLRDAPFRFDVEDWMGFFAQHGWLSEERVYAIDIASEVKRPFPFSWWQAIAVPFMPRPRREKMRRASGYVMLKRGY